MTDRAIQEARNLLAAADYPLPINVEAIAHRLGISVRMQELEEHVSGVLVIKGASAVIGVNGAHHLHRQRFTIAHEIGHYQLHRTSAQLFVDAAPVFFRDGRSAEGVNAQEIEANAFAAELLMPEAMLRDLFQRQPVDVFDDAALRRLASQFGVSPQALAIRLTKLGLVPV
ncbi:MAG TPA: ImmA/IrrE family metallo-endopeptidase [Pseudoclavibacter sp.]|nr:ImmA/IrrE family metallo-endopeptidase [Pseudoclavibacter sp.]